MECSIPPARSGLIGLKETRMPGIAGIIGGGVSGNRKALLDQMVKCMLHERFYVSGSVAVDRLDSGVGWVCHQHSYSDCLPIWNKTRDICLIFWGEHFAGGDEACADLIALYEKAGGGFFELLNGTFHGVVIDLRENKIVLFNDRHGLARIYCHESSDGFYFSAEAKSLLNILPRLRQLDMRSFGEFFSCGCALQGRTLFQGVSLLPPGSVWTFRPSQPVRKETYFQKETWESQPRLEAEEYYHRLKETFTRVLPRYFGGRQRVGLSLTGGLDSRMIISAAPSPPGDLPCYTFGGMYRDCEDVRIARQVAKLCRQPHEVITVGRDFFRQYLNLAERCVHITDGAMDVSGAVGMMVNRSARDMAPVRMTGNYGSEILRGSVMFKPALAEESMFDGEFVPAVRAAKETYMGERQGNRLSFIAFKQVPWFHYCRFAAENSQLTIRSPYLDHEMVKLAYQAPPGLLLNKQLAYRYTTDVNPALAGAPTDRGNLSRPAFVPGKAFEWWMEFFPRAEYCFDYGMPQWLAKVDRVLASLHLERLFLGQQKYYHFRIWYRRELAADVKSVLLDSRALQRPYLNGKKVEAMVLAHTRGTGNFTLEIHKLMSAELIQRQLIEAA